MVVIKCGVLVGVDIDLWLTVFKDVKLHARAITDAEENSAGPFRGSESRNSLLASFIVLEDITEIKRPCGSVVGQWAFVVDLNLFTDPNTGFRESGDNTEGPRVGKTRVDVFTNGANFRVIDEENWVFI